MVNGESGESGAKKPSPFDLNSSDNPGNIITQVQLKGANYEEWARAIRTSLRARRKWGFVDGTLAKPNEASMDDWWTVHSMIVSWILNTIDPSLRSTISYKENAKDLWDDITERFSVVNGPRIQQIKRDLAKTKQRGMTIMQYYGKLKNLWEDLAHVDPLPCCTCTGCKCEVNSKLQQRRDRAMVHQFLMGLDEDIYGSVRSTLLAVEPLPSINKVYSTIIQEERVRTINRTSEDKADQMALAANAGVRTRSGEKGRWDNRDRSMICTHCNRTGHCASGCFEVIGYPEWWGDRPKTSTKGGGSSRDQRSNENKVDSKTGSGHGRNKGSSIRANAVRGFSNQKDESANLEAEVCSIPGISGEQIQTLINLLSSQKTGSHEHMSGKNSNNLWIIDSGATNHMTGNREHFSSLRKIGGVTIRLPDGERVDANMEGNVKLDTNFVLKHVLYVPKLKCELISITQLMDDGNFHMHLTSNLCVIQDRITRTLIGAGRRRGGLYYFLPVSPAQALQAKVDSTSALLHNRMGHPSWEVHKLLSKVFGNSCIEKLNNACDVCQRAKHSRTSFSLSHNIANDCFDLVHGDLWGPYREASSCGAHYFLTIVDDLSRAVWIYLLVDKKSVMKTLINFFAYVDRHFGRKIKTFRSDNGTEFTCMRSYFLENGIVFQSSCAGTPQQNGRVERKHRHILNVARALRFQGNLPIKFWGECVLTAGYLINRTPSRVLHGKTPYELLHGSAPTYNHLRVFGSLCYAHIQQKGGDKFSPRSRRCIFVGYPAGKKAWRLYDLESNTFLISRDVKFFEEEFPYAKSAITHAVPTSDGCGYKFPSIFEENEPVGYTQAPPPLVQSNSRTDAAVFDESSPAVSNHDHDPTSPTSEPPTAHISPDNQAPLSHSRTEVIPVAQHNTPEQPAVQLMGRGHRVRKPPANLQDFVTNTTQVVSQNTHQAHIQKSGTRYPLNEYLSTNRFSHGYCSFLAAVTKTTEPTTFVQAMRDPRWRDAMQSETRALEDNQTWELTPLPPGKRTLGCKWIFNRVSQTILDDVQNHIIPSITHWQSPNFFAYVPANASTAGFLGEMLCTGFNVVGFNWINSPAATELEMIVTDWMGKLLKLPESLLFSGTGGSVIHGSTCEAVVCLLAAARDNALKKIGDENINRLVVYTSDQTHFTVQKATKIVGIPSKNFRIIPTFSSASFALCPNDVKAAMEKDLADGLVPLFLCATIGTTTCNAVDPLEGLCNVAKKFDVWVHVDAAYIGSACICPEYRHLLDGVEYADSISMNPHKWFLSTMDCCCLWLKEPKILVECLSSDPEYLRNELSDLKRVVDYKDWQISLTRRFRALKLWIVLRRYGVDNLMGHIRNGIEMAKHFEGLVKGDNRFEVVVERKFALICFRLRDTSGRYDVLELNKNLLQEVNSSGRAYMSHGVVGGIFVIRCAVGGAMTEKIHVDGLWKLIQEKTDLLLSETPKNIL